MVRTFDFEMDGVKLKVGVPKEALMESHSEEGVAMIERNKTEPIPSREWTTRRRKFIAECLNLATPDAEWTSDKLAEEFDTGVLNALSNAIYEKCGIKTTTVGEVTAA